MTKANDFMVIACDGIWDCLTSQQCITLVKEYLGDPSGTYGGNLSSHIERMFDKIIATDVASSGGIGCDNMTAVIIQFKH